MLATRLVTAILLGGGFLAALYSLPDALWAFFLLFFIGIAAMEWGVLAGFGQRGRRMFPWAVLGAAAGVLAVGAAAGQILLAAAVPFWLILVPFWLARSWRPSHPWVAALVGVLVLLPVWVALIQLRHTLGADGVLVLMLAVVLADSAAYFAGTRYGRTRLAPAISPGKTWEGVYGALIAVAVVSTLFCIVTGRSFWVVAGLVSVAAVSVLGDLFESLFKRQAGVKDSGHLLPGHGGMLDRIDGLTAALPVAAACLQWLEQSGWQ